MASRIRVQQAMPGMLRSISQLAGRGGGRGGRPGPGPGWGPSPFAVKPLEELLDAAAAANAARHTAELPPESPNYIDLPKPPQSEEPVHKTERGQLPVPRDIFHHRSSYMPKDKKKPKKNNAQAWTAAAHPQPRRPLPPPKTEREAWQRRLSATRREALETGLRGLWERQEGARIARQSASHARSEAHRKAAISEPSPLSDEVLTRGSVRASTALNTAVIRDPMRHVKQQVMITRTKKFVQAKRDARRDALMELYQAAGNFIVDEQELAERVEELFRPDYFRDENAQYSSGQSMWDMVGRPKTLTVMMSGVTRTESKLYEARRSEADRTTKRQKLVAEALTGGKMPVLGA